MDLDDLIRERADTIGLRPLEDLAPAREKLLAAARGERRPGRAKRWFWAAGVTAGLAAAATAVLSLGPADQVGVGVGVGVANADPVRVLSEAAAAALKMPAMPPRPDQFLYVKTYQADQHVREVWLSVDGTRDGLIEGTKTSGCLNGHSRIYGANNPKLEGTIDPNPCTPTPVYRTDLPTTADAMFAYLTKNHSGEKGDVNALGKDVWALADETVLPPASYAALFQAAAKVPGLKAIDHVTDAAGRPGVGITWPNPPGSLPEARPMVLVFDATTFTFLGTNAGAVTEKAYVDQVGQRP